MKPFARTILVSSLALASATLWWGTHHCEAPIGLIGPLEKKTPPYDWNAYVAYVAATNAVHEWPEVGETMPSQERKSALVAANAEALISISHLLLTKHVNLAFRIVPGGTHCEASWEKQIPIFMDCLGL
jgi:hypothetical protein